MKNGDATVGVRSVALVGNCGPAQTLTLYCLLKDCIDSSGWSERLSLTPLGLGDGVGRLTASEIETMTQAGLRVSVEACADVESEPADLGRADVIIADSDETADYMIQMGSATGKPVLCLADLIDPGAAHALELDIGIGELVDLMRAEIPDVVRTLIST
jgi:hypothetical protein